MEHSRAVGCGVTSSSARRALPRQPHGPAAGLLTMAHHGTIDPRLLGVHATSVTLHPSRRHTLADDGAANANPATQPVALFGRV